MSFHVIIPARYQSSRLPGKPLQKIGDKTMIEHVCLRARESGALSVTVATDSKEILNQVKSKGFNAVLTRDDHVSGSDRIFEASEILGIQNDQVIVNVQGDEPFIPSENISMVAKLIKQRDARMATLCCPIDKLEEVKNPNSVKVIHDKNFKAIYFSRSVIPYNREGDSRASVLKPNYFRHIGIYAYTKAFLKQFVEWPESHLEKIEKLEQLRVIENGYSIVVDVLKNAPPAGVDTPEDLAHANSYYKALGNQIG